MKCAKQSDPLRKVTQYFSPDTAAQPRLSWAWVGVNVGIIVCFTLHNVTSLGYKT